MKTKTTLILILLIITLTITACNNDNDNNNNNDAEYGLAEFNECLAEKGVVIYGSDWCPACRALVETLGGHEATKPIYIECIQNQEICDENRKTGYIPEIQINGELYQGQRTIQALAQATGCEAP